MQPIVINRRYYDEYFFDLANECSTRFDIGVVYENITKRWIDIFENRSEPTIIIYPDYLTDGCQINKFNSLDKQKLCNPDKKCIVLSSVKNAGQDLNFSSVEWLHHGGDFLFQMLQYPTLAPVKNKTLSKSWHCVSLSLLPRKHRLTLSAFLLGNYADTCFIKCSLKNHNNISWSDFYNQQHTLTPEVVNKIEIGWQLMLQRQENTGLGTYNVPPNHNALNFSLNLQQVYKESLVEFVNETTFYNKGIFVSEKYINSVYGFNFPIIIGNAGSVNYCRDLGFDMFDDVINHDYDFELDPEQRITAACTLNEEIINNKKLAAYHWQRCYSRLEKNHWFAKSKIYNLCRENAVNAVTDAIKTLNL